MNSRETEKAIYREHLTAALQRAKLNSTQVEAIIRKFDREPNSALAFASLHESFANEDTDAACLTVKAVIQRELAKLNRQHQGIDCNPVTRIAAYCRRLNDAISRCAVSIDGKDVSKEILEEAKIKIPSWAKSCTTYTANAQQSEKGLSVDVTL